jgi:hypothetical protein
VDGLVAVRTLGEVGLGVHHRQPVALVILARDLVVAEDLAGGPRRAVGRHAVLVRHVVVVAHDAVAAQVVADEEVVLLARHAVVEQEFVHLRIDAPAVVEVER